MVLSIALLCGFAAVLASDLLNGSMRMPSQSRVREVRMWLIRGTSSEAAAMPLDRLDKQIAK